MYYIRTLDEQALDLKELIATYGCRKDLKGLLEKSTGMQLRLNLYKGVGADKLSADVVKQEKETS